MLQLLVVIAFVTGYAPSVGGRNCDGTCGSMSSGLPPGPAFVACGYAWELGDVLDVDGYGLAICADRFGFANHSYIVDTYFPTEAGALRWGRRQVEVAKVGHVDLKSLAGNPCAEEPSQITRQDPLVQLVCADVRVRQEGLYPALSGSQTGASGSKGAVVVPARGRTATAEQMVRAAADGVGLLALSH